MSYPTVRPLCKKLPGDPLWDSVHTVAPVTRRSPVFRLLCSHRVTTLYTRTDYRNGPGGYSDSYAGEVCCACGNIIHETQTF